MKCMKCKKEINCVWETKKTYEGIDRHHNPPEEISRFLKEEWNGKIYDLCRKCHKILHKEITKILNKHSPSFKFINSDYYTMLKMNPKQIKESQKEIYVYTKNWVKKDDTKNIAKR